VWTAAHLLMGFRYDPALVQTLFHGVFDMKESATYQAILREGEAKGEANEARKMLLLQGRSRFGEPSPEVVAALQALTDVSRLEDLGVRLLQASSWHELLGLNGPNRRSRSRRKTS
jgi:predicted transposase YdaD